MEFWLLKLALFGETPVEWLESHLDLQWVGHHGVREILQQHFELIAENPDAGFMPTSGAISEVQFRSFPIPNLFKLGWGGNLSQLLRLLFLNPNPRRENLEKCGKL